MSSFTTSFVVDRTPDEVYAAINDVPGWWTGEVLGTTDVLGEEFSYRQTEFHYSKQRVVDLVPGQRIAWRVVEAHLSFAPDPHEWQGTEIAFDLKPHGEGTEVVFTHHGLGPELACYDDCSSGWRFYVDGSLRERLVAEALPR
ncbi:MAG: SRPBCC domain-containing protein [Mycobacteriales bacterium]